MRTSRAGISLIEFAIVVAMIGTLATIVIPRFNPNLVARKAVETTAKAFVSDLRLARQLALSERVQYYVAVNTAAHTYALYKGSVLAVNQVGHTRTIQTEITVGSDTTFGFETNGSGIIGYGTVITFGYGSQEWTITIAPATGRIIGGSTGAL